MATANAYEKLVQEVCRALAGASDVNTLAVSHDVTLTGASGATHQIDVLWEVELNGRRHRICVECKQLRRRVEKGHVAKLATEVRDLGNATGVIVTTAGFQTGAQSLAEHNNIRLLLVNPMLRTIAVKLVPIIYDFEDFTFEWDQAQVGGLLEQSGRQHFEFEIRGDPGDIWLLDSHGERDRSLQQIIRSRWHTPGAHRVEFEERYLECPLGLAKINAISFRATQSRIEQEFTIDGLSTARAIVEDLTSGEARYLTDDGTLE